MTGVASTQQREEVFVFPTSFAQERLWFLDQLVPGNAFYNVDQSLRLALPIDVKALEASINEIIRRHEILRTTFLEVAGEPKQIVHPSLKVAVSVVDLSGLPGAERELEAVRLATEEARKPFDLASGPLIRATLLRLG